MFHRVKSEVQDSEQKTQPQYGSTATGYQPEERGRAYDRQDREEVAAEERKETQTRIFDKEENTKEEGRTMERQEETQAQTKYPAREAEVRTRAPEPQAYGYQRPGQSAISRPSAYPGSYSAPASSYVPPSASEVGSYGAAASQVSAGERCLTIGRGINMSGEIEACDHLVVEGTVEAALKGAKVLEIAESGTFYGTVEIEEATIAGRFEGDITVNGRLTIKASGAITGSIAYRELEVEAGAMLDGRMTPLKGIVDPKSLDKYKAGSDASAMAKAKEIISKKDSREPANTEGNALFSKARAQY